MSDDDHAVLVRDFDIWIEEMAQKHGDPDRSAKQEDLDMLLSAFLFAAIRLARLGKTRAELIAELDLVLRKE